MKELKYIVYKEGKYFVSQCLNVEVSSFGETMQDAIDNLNEALQLYFEDSSMATDLPIITDTIIGETYINA